MNWTLKKGNSAVIMGYRGTVRAPIAQALGTEEAREATARLMVRAPELLERLKECEGELLRLKWQGSPQYLGVCSPPDKALLVQVRKLIKSLEGSK